MTLNLRLARVLTLPAILAAAPSIESEAQDRRHIQPSISLTEVHESDAFATPDHPRADFIMRVTPGFAATYESPTMTLTSRSNVDFERFARHTELTTSVARTQATVSLAYRATPRLSVTAGGDLLTTRTPRDFNGATGLTVTRARARRHVAHASVSRQFSAVTTGVLAYVFTGDRLGGSFAAKTHGADATFARRLSSRTEVRGRYRVQAFGFEPAGARSHVTSHAVSLGAGRAIAPRLRASLDVGPRVTAGVVHPELAAAIVCECASVNLALGYTRTRTTVIGLAGAADVRTAGLTIGRTFGRSLEVQVAPSFFQSTLAAAQADVYALAIDVKRPISTHLALGVTMQGSVQRGNLYPRGAGDVVPRHTILMRLVAGRAIAQPQR